MTKKGDPVLETLANIKKRLGKTAAVLLSDGSRSDLTDVIPTGIEVVDNYVLGVGGLPCGRLIEVFSDEGIGKTSFMLACIAATQKAGGVVALAETECSLDSDRAAVFGCDLERVINLQEVDCMEDVISSIEATLHSLPDSKPGDPPNLIAWDSIAASQSAKELKEGVAAKNTPERAIVMSKAMRVLCGLAIKKRTTLLFINQIRDRPGIMFGDSSTTPCGKAVKFHASVRLRLYPGKVFKSKGEHIGTRITIAGAKNKVSPPWRKAVIRLDYSNGFDNSWSTISFAKDKKLLPENTRVSIAAHQEALELLDWEPSDPELLMGTGEVAWDEEDDAA